MAGGRRPCGRPGARGRKALTAFPPAPVLLAPDGFKGTLRATEVAAALARGLDCEGRRVDRCPLADGGDGTLEVLMLALGGETLGATVHDPLGRETRAGFGLVEDGATAVVETAQAIGLDRVAPGERDAEGASSFGAGELILAAVEAGARQVVVGAGGSATSDGGAGALEAIERGGGLRGASLVVLCDVRTTFERAAEVFGPQKGADPGAVRRLGRRLHSLAGRLPRDPTGIPGSGAGGGLAGGLWAAHGAALAPGAAFVLDACDYDERMRAARAVVVGEGRLDRQTLDGKAPGEAAVRARQAGVPCFAVCGRRALDDFDARILDLQAIIEAGDRAALEAAGRELGRIA